MKKLISSLLPLLLIFVMAACGQKVPSPEEVANKINAGDTLSESDYTAIIDYCGKYAREAQQYFDIINEQPNDSTVQAVTASNDMATLYAGYKYLDLFRPCLAAADMSQLSADNQKKVNEYAKYEAFPLPGGEAAELENPNVVGMIEQTPNSDTTGVISEGVGEAVDINVK